MSNILPIHNRLNVTFDHGKGVYLFDEKGEKYLDFGAGIAVNALGHCHNKLVAAINKQSQKLWHVSNIYHIKELEEFATKLTNRTFADYAFFCNSGAESLECAVKMMRRYFYVQGNPKKYRIITFKGAFHGRTIAAISAAAKEQYLEGFKPGLEGFDNVEFGNIEAVKNAISDETAGILIEPIQGEQGIKPADKKFMQELRSLADEHNLLLGLDEVQCGYGRTGYFYAYEYYGIKPDILASAKAIAGGFPLGACLATKEAAKGMTAGTHGTTYGGNPLAMSVASAAFDEIANENSLAHVQKMGNILKEELEKLKSQFPNIIDEVRGLGLMLGIKINENYKNSQIVEKFLENKLLVIPAGENVVRILPPLIINEDHIKEAVEKITSSLGEI